MEDEDWDVIPDPFPPDGAGPRDIIPGALGCGVDATDHAGDTTDDAEREGVKATPAPGTDALAAWTLCRCF